MSRRRTRLAKERVSVPWRDVNKGDRNSMAVRSRLVGREFRWQDLSSRARLRQLLSCKAAGICDMGELYITLQEEDATPGMRTRDAAHEWNDFANTKIAGIRYQVGFEQCISVL